MRIENVFFYLIFTLTHVVFGFLTFVYIYIYIYIYIRITLDLQNIHLKIKNSFKYEYKGNSTELSNFIWGKKKEKINVDLDWSILDKAKSYSPASGKCMLCLKEKYYIIFSIKNPLNKRNELVTKCRLENKFYLANYRDIPP